jgi:hypothetical protein
MIKGCITRVSLKVNKMSKEEMTPEEKDRLATEAAYKKATRLGAWGWILFFLVALIIFLCVRAMINNNRNSTPYRSYEEFRQDYDYEQQLQEHEEKTGGQ